MRRGRPDRRVAAGLKVDGGSTGGQLAARSSRLRVDGNDRPSRRGPRPRGPYRWCDRLRRHCRLARRPPRGDCLPTRAARLLEAAALGHRRADRLDLRDQHRALATAARVGAVLARDRRRPRAAAAAGDRHDQPLARRRAAGRRRRRRQAADRDRGSRQRRDAVHRQDRHADRRRRAVHRRPRSRRPARTRRARPRSAVQRRDRAGRPRGRRQCPGCRPVGGSERNATCRDSDRGGPVRLRPPAHGGARRCRER
ncbi:MAG: hypothetical protein JWQ48_2824 [Conexibacter sp.]|nr:hypothetical protein [Conexibacter sp.]